MKTQIVEMLKAQGPMTDEGIVIALHGRHYTVEQQLQVVDVILQMRKRGMLRVRNLGLNVFLYRAV